MSRLLAAPRSLFALPGFGGLLTASCLLGMAFAFVVPFLSLWATEGVGMSARFFSLFMTVTTVSSLVTGIGVGRWSDRHRDRRRVLLIAGVAGLLGYVGYAYAQDRWWLLLLGSTALALASVGFSQLFAYTREHYGDAVGEGITPGLAMSVVRVSFSLAWTVGPAIGAALMAGAGYRGVFLGAAGLYAVFVAVVAWRVQRDPAPETAARQAEQRRTAGPAVPVWRILIRRRVAGACAAFLLVFAAHAVNMMVLPLFVTKALGGSASSLGVVFAVGPVVEIPLMLWFGRLAAKGRQMTLLRIGGLATVGYFIALACARTPEHVYMAQVLSGVSFSVISNVAILYFQDMLPGEPGLATALFSNSANTGNLLGYFTFGALLEWGGHRGVFFVCAALSAGMLALLLATRPTAADRAAG